MIANAGDQVPLELQEGCSGAALAIWTTTPWTMPANAAVAVNEKLQYSIVEAQVSDIFFAWLPKHKNMTQCRLGLQVCKL